MNRLLEYIQRLVNEEIKQYPSGYFHDKQLRIPFKDYGNGHSYIDHYIDWIKAVSKKGTLPKPSVNFKEMVTKGIEKFHDNKHANKNSSSRNYMSKDELQDFMKNVSTLFEDAKFKNGNLYVERQIGVTINGMHQESQTLFNDLTQSYNNTVGGCWAFREGEGEAYCSDTDANFFITFKGYMFLDDIYWDELIRLETRKNGEVEVRTYPNGRVQLEEIELHGFGKYITLTAKDFDGPRIINSTYLGNNGTFNGNYAKLGYEGIGYENQYIDREGNEYKDIETIVSKELESGKKIEDIVDAIKDLGNGVKRVRFYDKYNFIDEQGNLLFPNRWLDECGGFYEGFAQVKLNNKGNWVDKQGNLLFPNRWFDDCYHFENGFAPIKSNDKWNWIDTQGNLLYPNQWFDRVGNFRDDFASIKLNGKENWIDAQGNILSPNQWFDWCGFFNDGFAPIKLNNKCNWVDKKGNILSPNQWFDRCFNFYDGFAIVILEWKYNLIDEQGKLVSPNQWFDVCYPFSGGFAEVKLNDAWYTIDTKGNFYDRNTKQPIPNPAQKNESLKRRTNQQLVESRFRNYLNELVREIMIG